jgi:hypothetical protein
VNILLRLVLWFGLAALLPAAEPALTLVAGGRSVAITAAEFGALPHLECTAKDPHTGKDRRFSGVAVRDLLARADAPFGGRLRGRAQQLAVLARSSDGYGVVYALAEFDAAYRDQTIILADREDGNPLPAAAGPFQLVAPGDHKAGRWARMVTSLEIIPVGADAARSPGHP